MALGAFQLYESEVPSSWLPNGHLRASRAQQFMRKQDGAADPIRGNAGSSRGGSSSTCLGLRAQGGELLVGAGNQVDPATADVGISGLTDVACLEYIENWSEIVSQPL